MTEQLSRLGPYLDVLRPLLADASRNGPDDHARQVALYGHRILTQLLMQRETVPRLQRQALASLDALLDDLTAALAQIGHCAPLIAELGGAIRRQPDYARAEPLLQHAVGLLTQHRTERGNGLLASIARTVLALQQGMNDAALAEAPHSEGARGPVEPLDAAQKLALQAYLRQRFPTDAEVQVGATRQVLGGASKLTVFVELRAHRELPAEVVLRIDQTDKVVASSVADEHRLLSTVHAHGLPVPRPLAVEPGREVLGAPFLMVSRMPGHNIGDVVEVFEPTRAFAVGVAHTLAKLHRIPVAELADHLPGGRGTTRERCANDIATFEQSWRTSGQTSVALELAYAWLKANLDHAEGRRAIVHGDVGCHNMLGHGGELTALLDWETAVIGNPAQDLTYARMTVEQMMPWDEFLLEYERAGGIRPSDEELDFYLLWRNVFSMHFAMIVRAYVDSGLANSITLAHGAQFLYQRLNHGLHQAVRQVYEKSPRPPTPEHGNTKER